MVEPKPKDEAAGREAGAVSFERIIRVQDDSTSRLTLELTRREHTASNIIGENNDERKAIEQSG